MRTVSSKERFCIVCRQRFRKTQNPIVVVPVEGRFQTPLDAANAHYLPNNKPRAGFVESLHGLHESHIAQRLRPPFRPCYLQPRGKASADDAMVYPSCEYLPDWLRAFVLSCGQVAGGVIMAFLSYWLCSWFQMPQPRDGCINREGLA